MATLNSLNARERRFVLYGAIAVSIYLLLFFGHQVFGGLGKRYAAYQQLVTDARNLKAQLKFYDDRILVAKKLMEVYQLDPAKLKQATVVGEASSQIQKTAQSSGLQVGAIRESPAKSAAKELATLQFEGAGPIPAVLGLIKRLETLGYPLVIDAISVTPDPSRPNQIKLTMTVVILDFDQWKTEDKPHA